VDWELRREVHALPAASGKPYPGLPMVRSCSRTTTLQRSGQDGYLLLRDVIDSELLDAIDGDIDSVVAENPPPPGTVGAYRFWVMHRTSIAGDHDLGALGRAY
jgi:hypothetical protein